MSSQPHPQAVDWAFEAEVFKWRGPAPCFFVATPRTVNGFLHTHHGELTIDLVIGGAAQRHFQRRLPTWNSSHQIVRSADVDHVGHIGVQCGVGDRGGEFLDRGQRCLITTRVDRGRVFAV